MSITTGADLIAALRRYQLLDAGQIDVLFQDPQMLAADPRNVARDLIMRGWLTPFQANQVLTDRATGLVLGDYVLLERIGSGGMGQVYKARHDRMSRVVALKVIRKEHLDSPEAVRRFHREIERVSQLSHPNLVMVLGAPQVGDTHFLVMEYVEGTDLGRLIRQRGRLTVDETREYIRQAALGLQYAHQRGLVHRDVKPSNLLVTNEPIAPGGPRRVKVLGLGRLKEVADAGEQNVTLTQGGTAIGTPDYVAPEQAIDSRQADIRSDIYSLGCTFYHLLAGHPPFVGGSLAQKLAWHLSSEPKPIEAERPDLPAALGPILRKMIAKRPENRYQTPAQVAEALAFLATGTAAPPAPERTTPLRPLDENVQFTVYRPRAVQPGTWYPLLAFAHLSERRPDAPPGEPDPVEEVRRQAGQALGSRAAGYQTVTQDSRHAVPREGELTLVPEVPGVEFNPPRRSFLWLEPVHREEFRLRASAGMEGQTARGRLTIFLGHILVADVPLSLRVDNGAKASAPPESSSATRYRKIFASYSHKDLHIVEEFERYARALGDRYLRDWVELRAGEVWDDRLMAMIGEADVFQLFWSSNSMHSTFVRREWEHALSLRRRDFIRPVHWEAPLPEADGLPPDELRRLHFQRIHAASRQSLDLDLDLHERSEPTLACPSVRPARRPAQESRLDLPRVVRPVQESRLDIPRVGRPVPPARRVSWALGALTLACSLVFLGFLGFLAFPGPGGERPSTGGPAVGPPDGTHPKEVTNSVGMWLVLIPAGEFLMGSPRDEEGRRDDEGQHEVEIPRPFYLGMHEVTQAESREVMGNNPSWFSAAGGGKDKVKDPDTSKFPVESVSWEDARDFCARLSALPQERAAERVYRLPTEAEWEYACRAGTQTPFPSGDSFSSRQANFDGNKPYGGAGKGPFLRRTTRVGSYEANPWGLFDMHGNVRVWCQDWYGPYDKAKEQDPQGPADGKQRVLRGGSWGSAGKECRAACRNRSDPRFRERDVGFRVVLIAGAEAP